MKRTKTMVLAGVLAVGGLGAATSVAKAQAPTGAAPRYFYGLGPNGYGYYYYPTAPASAPTYRGGFYSAPARPSARASGTTPSTYREYGSGRNLYLAKPWLKPLR